jgi:hypothetical protein
VHERDVVRTVVDRLGDRALAREELEEVTDASGKTRSRLRDIDLDDGVHGLRKVGIDPRTGRRHQVVAMFGGRAPRGFADEAERAPRRQIVHQRDSHDGVSDARATASRCASR